MDHKEQLKAMLTSMIKGNEEAASVELHDYLVSKGREVVANLKPTDNTPTEADE